MLFKSYAHLFGKGALVAPLFFCIFVKRYFND
jgi:hypothetical protein